MENIRDYILPTTVEESESAGKAKRPAGAEYSMELAAPGQSISSPGPDADGLAQNGHIL